MRSIQVAWSRARTIGTLAMAAGALVALTGATVTAQVRVLEGVGVPVTAD